MTPGVRNQESGVGRRAGFTLIEMIVVIGIILILAALLVGAVASPIMVQDKAKRGATQLQMMLRIAKTRAVADGAPRGLRFSVDSDKVVRQVQLIEQPPDFVALMQPDPSAPAGTPWQPNPITIKSAIVNGNNEVIAQLSNPIGPNVEDFTGGLSTGAGFAHDDPSWPVQGDRYVTLENGQTVIQPGDYLEVQGGGLLHRIGNVYPGDVFPSYVVLRSAPPNFAALGQVVGPTAQWRVIRQPRVLKGETPLLLPQDVGIDLNDYKNLYNYFPTDPTQHLYLNLPPSSPAGTIDLLFAPSGRVIGALGAQDRVVLWVRDVTRDLPYQNNPMLISIHTRTGFISVQPVNVNDPTNVNKFNTSYGDNWWVFTQDGRLSGL